MLGPLTQVWMLRLSTSFFLFFLLFFISHISVRLLTGTTTSQPYRSHLPPEILDCIIDLLHDQPETLNQCCLVSKSWVPRTRKHVFAYIEFRGDRAPEAWKKTFPDPTNSPAHHTHTLSIWCPWAVRVADAEEGGWIRAFSRVTRLEVWGNDWSSSGSEVSLVPFHNFSPVLKSLEVVSTTIPRSQIIDLVCSLPLLEDLCVVDDGVGGGDRDPGPALEPSTSPPSNSPPLTGILELYPLYGMEPTTRQLLGLPNGLHFRKLVWTWCLDEDIRWMTALVAECSDTLECIDIECRPSGMFLRSLRLDLCFT